ncbi:MAG: patatin-like phospholipase family protein [Gemmatimonadota bacterium]|nr:MAG: patatin-like phospholipase family protein [Gemmatimonadota bacterium]
MRRALVMAAGGSRGAFEVGAAHQLIIERGLWFDVIAGVSIGSINASQLGQAKDHDESKALVEELKQLWFAIKGNGDIYEQWYPRVPEWLNAGLTLLNNKKSLYHLKPARALIERNVDPERLRNSGVEVRFGYVDLKSGRYIAANNRDHPDLIGAVLASGSIPATFPPVELPGDQEGVDGGVRNSTPLADALDALRQWPAGDQPDEMWVVIPSTRPKDILKPELIGIELKSWLRIGEIAINLMRDEIQVNDVKHVLEINELIKNNCSPDPKYRYVDIKLVFADEDLGSPLTFDPEWIRRNFKYGYSRAKEVTVPAKLPLS